MTLIPWLEVIYSPPTKSSLKAKKEANDAAVAADLEIAQKQNELAVKKANLQKISDTEQAIADAAYKIQEQKQRKEIEIANAEANIAKQEKEIEVREKMVAVKQKELEAEIQKKAEAERQAKIQESEANLFQQQKDAEATATPKNKELSPSRKLQTPKSRRLSQRLPPSRRKAKPRLKP